MYRGRRALKCLLGQLTRQQGQAVFTGRSFADHVLGRGRDCQGRHSLLVAQNTT